MFFRLILVLAGILPIPACIAQINPGNFLQEYEQLAEKHPPGLVYLQLNKGIYEKGDDIWFKAYVMDSRSLEPMDQDTTLYVSLISADTKEAILQDKILVNNGFSSGNLFINSAIPPGDYLLAAFTGSSFYKGEGEFKAFRKIKIKDRSYTAPKSTPLKTPPPAITFFPEGGNLVLGLENSVAFKINNQDTDSKFILLENGVPLQHLEAGHQGMGKFLFTPKKDKAYAVRLGGQLWPLPEIMKEGISLRLLNNSDRYTSFLVNRTSGISYEKILISAQVRGVVYAMYEGSIKKDSLIFKLPTDKFPRGIVEITLYNEGLDPLAERLFYINGEEQLNIEARLPGAGFEVKDKVKLTIRVTDRNGDPVSAHLGLSIYDSFYKNPEDNLDIVSYTHLYAQIRGKLQDPDYYFNPDNPNRLNDLDLLLMTQGWRKYVWSTEELKKSVVHEAILNDRINGKMERKKKQPATLMVFTAEQTDLLNPVSVNSDGHFHLSPENMLMGHHMYFKPLISDEDKGRFKIRIFDTFKTIDTLLQKKSLNYPHFSSPAVPREAEYSLGGQINLNEVLIKARGKSFSDRYMARLDSMAKDLNPDFVCKARILNCDNCGTGTKPVAGEMYKKRITPGRNHYMNVLYYYPDYTEEELMTMFNIYRAKGYQREREFYQPDYDLNPAEKTLEDHRKALVWKPAIITDANGEAVIEFYCSDVTGRFIGKIEGLDINGLQGVSEFKFMVTEPAAK